MKENMRKKKLTKRHKPPLNVIHFFRRNYDTEDDSQASN